MASVTLEGAHKVFEHRGKVHVAVEALDLAVRDGEFVVFVGPSGCGKSTTLRMIAGLETPTAGTVRIGERVVNDVPPRDRDIAMVFQTYALYPQMTVYRNLAFALSLRKLPRTEIDARVRATAALLGLEPLLDRKPRHLSGGERQRVAVGRAIVRQPQVFLFDEPLSNLDAKLRVQMRRELAALRRRLGTTTIYVTHDQLEAMTLGDRIVVMHAGRMQQVDAPLALYRRPANTFVATFIGTPPMKLVRGAIVAGEGAWFESAGGNFRFRLSSASGTPPAGPGARIILGIRPEALHIAAGGKPATRARIDEVEPLGSETLVTLSAGDVPLVARVTGAVTARRGDVVDVSAPPEALHWFDAERETRLD